MGKPQRIAAVRALPTDGATIAGRVQAIPPLYVVVTYSGVTPSPLLGRLVAREVGRHEVEPMLAAFRPERFRPAPAAVP